MICIGHLTRVIKYIALNLLHCLIHWRLAFECHVKILMPYTCGTNVYCKYGHCHTVEALVKATSRFTH